MNRQDKQQLIENITKVFESAKDVTEQRNPWHESIDTLHTMLISPERVQQLLTEAIFDN